MSSTDNLTSTLTTPTTTQTSSVTTTQTTAATATDHLTNDQIAGICGGVISSVVVIVIIIIIICFVWRRRRNKKSDKKASPPSPPSADDLHPQPQPQPQPPSQMAVERKPKSRPHHALQPPQPSISSNGESYMSVPDVSTNETYEIGSTVPSIRNSSSSIDNDYENNPTRESNYRESNYRDSNYGEYIVPMENVPDQGLDSPRANPSSDNDFYYAMDNKRLQASPSPEFYQNPDPPPPPCLSRGYVNVSQENVSQDHSSTTALPSSGITKHESVQTKPLGSQQPVGSKRPDPIGAENGEVKGPQDPRGYKRQESDGGKEDRLKVPKHAVSPKTAVMDKCVKPVVAVKPGGGNGVKINPKLKNIASKFDETAKSNGAVGQKESLLTMHSWDKTPTPQSPRKDSTTAGQGDSDEDSDIDYENVNDYQNTPSKQVEPRRSPAGAPRNLKAHPDIHNREQRQIIGNKQKKGPAVGR